jgi:hypothetical protein
MNSHKNARLTQLGRVHLMHQIARIGLQEAAAQAGISKRRTYIWHSRWNECGETGLCDRSSRPASSPNQTQSHQRERIIQLRRNHRLIYGEIASRVGLSVATVGAFAARPRSPSYRLSSLSRLNAAMSGKHRGNSCTWT